MSHADKINKLGRAIREYRGRKIESTGKWETPPNPGARSRVERWLGELGQGPDQIKSALRQIDAFPTFAHYRTWLSALSVLTQPFARKL